jgi:hypothetical protein
MRLDDDLDRIMARDDEIVPSSGFVGSVMDEVRREASAPPAIPFPWKRVLPGIAFVAVALVSAVILGFDRLVAAVDTPLRLPAALEAASRSSLVANSGWIGLAVLLTLASVMFSLRYASGRS